MNNTAAIMQFQKKQEAKFICSACGEDRGCNCNAPAVEKAARALAENPGMSDRAIAAKAGVSDKTVAKARNSTAERSAVEASPRVGADGKSRVARSPKINVLSDPSEEHANRANALSRQLSGAMDDFERSFNSWLSSNPPDEAKTLLTQTLQLSSEGLLRLASDLF